MGVGENKNLRRILRQHYTPEMGSAHTPGGEYIRDLDEISKYIENTRAPDGRIRVWIETNFGVVEVNKYEITHNGLILSRVSRGTENMIRTLPHSKNRIDHFWRFYYKQLLFAKEDTASFVITHHLESE